jgi:hypothetical protein
MEPFQSCELGSQKQPRLPATSWCLTHATLGNCALTAKRIFFAAAPKQSKKHPQRHQGSKIVSSFSQG